MMYFSRPKTWNRGADFKADLFRQIMTKIKRRPPAHAPLLHSFADSGSAAIRSCIGSRSHQPAPRRRGADGPPERERRDAT
jgi:hypothetical protein